jgi:hypothetical protein
MLTLLQRWMKALQRKTEQQPGSAWTSGVGGRHLLYDEYCTGRAGDHPRHNWFGSKNWFFGHDPRWHDRRDR